MRKSRLIARLAVVLLATACVPAVPGAQPMPSQGLAEGGQPSSAKPGILNEIGIDQRIGEQLPLDLPFTDETGRAVRLGDYFGKRPVILALVYYECPMLCTQVLNGLVSALGVMNFEAGREFDVVAVSFNPKDGLGRLDPPADVRGWIPLHVRRREQAVCARRGDTGADTEGRARQVLLRDRVFGARYQVRPHRGVGGAHRHAHR